MLSISNLSGTIDAVAYYGLSNYYATDNQAGYINESSWFGQGALALGLKGQVNPDQFKEILDGILPDGTKLGRIEKGERVHAAGIDLTFSAPKSVSLLAEIKQDKKILKAHEKAVKYTLDYIQNNYLRTRITIDGVTKKIPVDKLVAITINEHQSRNHDPHLHTHCILANLVQDDGGKWRSAFFGKIFDNKILLGNIYRVELSRRLNQLGYKIDNFSNNSFELAGFTEEVLRHFSTRSQEIEELADKLGLDDAKTNATLALTSRKSKSATNLEDLLKKWQSEYQAKQKETPRPDNVYINKTRAKDYKLMIKDAVTHLSERRSTFAENHILINAINGHFGEIKFEDLKNSLSQQIYASNVLDKYEGPEYLSVGKIEKIEERLAKYKKEDALVTSHEAPYLFTTISNLKCELKTIKLMLQGKNAMKPIAADRRTLASLTNSKLNKSQQEAAKIILENTDRVMGLQGYAGTGKTYMLQEVEKIAHYKGYNLTGLAPTGKAVRALKDANIKARTLASFLMQYDGVAAGRGTDKGRFDMKQEYKRRLLVVDESSMIATRDMQKFLTIADQLNIRVLLIGDKAQLPAIDAGSPFEQLQKAGMRTAIMNHIVRQKDEKLKQAINYLIDSKEDKKIAKAFATLEKSIISLDEKKKREELAKFASNYYLGLADQAKLGMLIAVQENKLRRKINEMISSKLRGKEYYSQKIFISYGLSKAQTVRDLFLRKKGTYLNAITDLKKYQIRKDDLLRYQGQSENKIKLVDKNNQTIELSHHTFLKTMIPGCLKENIYGVGEKIAFTRNSKDFQNGSTAIVKSISHDTVSVKLVDRQNILVFKREDPKLMHSDHAYALTVHKAQGQTIDHIMSAMPSKEPGTYVGSHKTFYTLITRAKHGAKIITHNKNNLKDSIEKNKGVEIGSIEHQSEIGKDHQKYLCVVIALRIKLNFIVNFVII